MEQTSSKIWLWALATALALAVALWLWLGYWPASVPENDTVVAGPTLSSDDTTAVIDQELNVTDFGDVEKDLQSTEADLQSL